MVTQVDMHVAYPQPNVHAFGKVPRLWHWCCRSGPCGCWHSQEDGLAPRQRAVWHTAQVQVPPYGEHTELRLKPFEPTHHRACPAIAQQPLTRAAPSQRHDEVMPHQDMCWPLVEQRFNVGQARVGYSGQESWQGCKRDSGSCRRGGMPACAGGTEGRFVAQVLLLPEALDGEEAGSPSCLGRISSGKLWRQTVLLLRHA